jgi:hypothetical protein
VFIKADSRDVVRATICALTLPPRSIVFSWAAPESLVRPELVAIAREVGGFGEVEATMFARSVQCRQPPLSPAAQETEVRSLAANAALVNHEAMWTQVKGGRGKGGASASASDTPIGRISA